MSEPHFEPWCKSCGSPAVEMVEYLGPTGVVAPDGTQEMTYQVGMRCKECGAIEELW